MRRFLPALVFCLAPLLWAADKTGNDYSQRPWFQYLKSDSLQLAIPETGFDQLQNGIPVHFAEDKMLPRAFIKIYFEGGAAEEPAELTGLTSLWSKTVEYSGSEKYPRAELARQLENHGSEFGSASGLERSSFVLSSLSNYFESDLQMILQVLSAPRFDQEDFSLMQKQLLQSVEKRGENPALAANLLAQQIIWQNTVAARLSDSASLQQINTGWLRQWQEKMYQAGRLRIVLAGDVDYDRVKALLNQTLGQLRPQSPTDFLALLPEKIPEQDYGYIYHLPANLPQSTFLWTAPGVAHGSPDYYALKVYNYLLGGGSFNSYLTQQIRTQKGWAYSIYSGYTTGPKTGTVSVFAQSGNENASDLIVEVEKILARPELFVNEKEVQKAKQAIVNQFVFLYETPEQLIEQKLSIMWDGLDESYLSGFVSNIQKVSLADVRRVAARYYRPGSFFLVLTGPQSVADDYSGKFPAGRRVKKVSLPR